VGPPHRVCPRYIIRSGNWSPPKQRAGGGCITWSAIFHSFGHQNPPVHYFICGGMLYLGGGFTPSHGPPLGSTAGFVAVCFICRPHSSLSVEAGALIPPPTPTMLLLPPSGEVRPPNLTPLSHLFPWGLSVPAPRLLADALPPHRAVRLRSLAGAPPHMPTAFAFGRTQRPFFGRLNRP